MTGKTLFVSQNPYERAENMRAIYDAYDGPKEFRHGLDEMRGVEREGFACVVCDTLPKRIEGKDMCRSVFVCHAITGNKHFGMDEDGPWVDPVAFQQTDIAISASEDSRTLVARQLGIPVERVHATGIPRTDAYVSKRKGDGGTFLAGKRAYLYVPTYRDPNKGGWYPRIDWAKVDSMLGDDEVLAVKRHYFTMQPLVQGSYEHIVELDPMEPVGSYLVDCDALLTDYSSIEFDGYLLGKPSVLTTDDMGEYLRDRGMYHEYPTFYSSRWVDAEGNGENLVWMLREAAEVGMTDVERRCVEQLAGMCDGHATERVCELIRWAVNG